MRTKHIRRCAICVRASSNKYIEHKIVYMFRLWCQTTHSQKACKNHLPRATHASRTLRRRLFARALFLITVPKYATSSVDRSCSESEQNQSPCVVRPSWVRLVRLLCRVFVIVLPLTRRTRQHLNNLTAKAHRLTFALCSRFIYNRIAYM